MEPEILMDDARADHPEVVAELERLQGWVAVCLGAEIVAWQGPEVN